MGLRDKIMDFWTIMKYNLRIEIRYPISYLAAVLNTVFWMLAFVTLILIFANGEESALAANLIAWGLASYVIFSQFMSEVGFGIIRLQRRGTLEQILLTPVSISVLPIGLAGYSLVIALMFMLLMVGLLILLSGATLIIVNPLGGLVAFVFMLLMFYGAALILAAASIRLKRSSWALINVFTMLFMIFCGTFYSFAMVPEVVVLISRLILFSYAVDLFRTTLLGLKPELISTPITIGSLTVSSVLFEWLLVVSLSIVFVVVGKFYLLKTINDAKREGTLGAY